MAIFDHSGADMMDEFGRLFYLPSVGQVNTRPFEGSNKAREGTTMSWEDKASKLQLTQRFKGCNEAREEASTMPVRSKETAVRLKEKAIEIHLTKRFTDRVFFWPEWLIMMLLELKMAKKVRLGEIKGGDSVIVDLDSDGHVVVLGGSSGAPAEQAEEPVVV
ncbi:hypothetical protein ABFX02_03G000600 [Erythranthe guttata]